LFSVAVFLLSFVLFLRWRAFPYNTRVSAAAVDPHDAKAQRMLNIPCRVIW